MTDMSNFRNEKEENIVQFFCSKLKKKLSVKTLGIAGIKIMFENGKVHLYYIKVMN